MHSAALVVSAFLCINVFGCAGTSSKMPSESAYQHRRLDAASRVVQVRKIADRLIGASDSPVSDGFGAPGHPQARLLWRNRWTWSNDEHAVNRELNHGLKGGPTLSLSVPLADTGLSVETRYSALQYGLPEHRARPSLPDEWIRNRDNRVSVEAGLVLDFAIGR